MIYKDGRKANIVSVNMRKAEVAIQFEDGSMEITDAGSLHATGGINDLAGRIAEKEKEQREKENPHILDGRRWCWYVEPCNVDTDGNYIPSIVVENESGHFPARDWKWGKDFNIACQAAKQLNERRGVSESEALDIVGSSIRASIIKHGI